MLRPGRRAASGAWRGCEVRCDVTFFVGGGEGEKEGGREGRGMITINGRWAWQTERKGGSREMVCCVFFLWRSEGFEAMGSLGAGNEGLYSAMISSLVRCRLWR